MNIYNQLQLREFFHIEFLRWMSRKIKADNYALKGGTNLRFFFNSIRYSEDMDLDIRGIIVGNLKALVMKILLSPSFNDTLRPFGIERIIPPDISKAKQTETTQRFKIHLITSSGEDLFTKIEFSRRGFKGKAVVQPVSDNILRAYKMTPLLVSHYEIESTIAQKIGALAGRSIIQARDIFDLYMLSSQYTPRKTVILDKNRLTKAHDNIFEISFVQFRDSVLSYLSPEDRASYESADSWDEIKLKTANFIAELRGNHG